MKHIDYIIKPSIKMKNKQILTWFADNYVPILEEHGFDRLYEEVVRKVKRLQTECYKSDPLSLDSEVYDKFNSLQLQVADKSFYIHEEGLNQNIVDHLTDEVCGQMSSGKIQNISESKFKQVKAVDLGAS